MFKSLIEDLREFANNHYQIHSFGFGDITQLTNQLTTYTGMYVVPTFSSFQESQITYNLSIVIADRVNVDLSNQIDVMSDTQMICRDVFSYLNGMYIIAESSIVPFLERSENILGGWTLSIAIATPFDFNVCVLPIRASVELGEQLTLKKVLKDLNYLCNNHMQVNSFGFGDLKQLTNDIVTDLEPYYTRVYVIPDDSAIVDNVVKYRLQIVITDRLNSDYSNQLDVLNDTLAIATDLFATLSFQYSIPPSTVECFTDNYETIIAGWVLKVEIQQAIDGCDLPIE